MAKWSDCTYLLVPPEGWTLGTMKPSSETRYCWYSCIKHFLNSRCQASSGSSPWSSPLLSHVRLPRNLPEALSGSPWPEPFRPGSSSNRALALTFDAPELCLDLWWRNRAHICFFLMTFRANSNHFKRWLKNILGFFFLRDYDYNLWKGIHLIL